MRRLPRPTITAQEVLELCIASIRDVSLTKRLRLAAPVINAAEANYVSRGQQAKLHTIVGTNGVAGHVTTAEMERVYKGTFVRSVNTRDIYGAIKSAPENDMCPLCSQRTVSTLDHYLPQSAHPTLTVTSANLVPACAECNKTKLALEAETAGDQTFHPYFEDADDARWLFAEVQEISPAALVFSPVPPTTWANIKQQRIAAHFKTFGLASLYASHSAVELNNIRFGLQELARRNTPQQISDHLRRRAESCAAVHVNSWQRATYDALANSTWFCSGGFM